jgi:uncharacterized integral membrane protein (TIGR00698 family)
MSEALLVRAKTGVGEFAPGVVLSVAVALAAFALAPLVARAAPIPPIVIALFIGIALSGVAEQPRFKPGITFCVKKLLRWAIALLGLRIALGEIAALGVATALVVIGAMALTIASGLLLARSLRQSAFYGALAGAGTAVCGASATLATATVLPDYKGKEVEVVFVVVAVNGLSTVAMILYPALCAWLGFDDRLTGIMLGATIHDVAQVAGAGYAVSDAVGNAAVVVKLFRVLLLVPVVVALGWWFAQRKAPLDAVKASVPVFALVFLALCILNSIVSALPSLAPVFASIKKPLVEAAGWGLLIAIAALGLGTSVRAVMNLGWRHIATVLGTTAVILVAVTAALAVLG